MWPTRVIKAFQKFKTKSRGNWKYVKWTKSSLCCYDEVLAVQLLGGGLLQNPPGRAILSKKQITKEKKKKGL